MFGKLSLKTLVSDLFSDHKDGKPKVRNRLRKPPPPPKIPKYAICSAKIGESRLQPSPILSTSKEKIRLGLQPAFKKKTQDTFVVHATYPAILFIDILQQPAQIPPMIADNGPTENITTPTDTQTGQGED